VESAQDHSSTADHEIPALLICDCLVSRLSAAQDEISWVQTAYLIAEIIVIPLSISKGLTSRFKKPCLYSGKARL
jgi:DHA2 family multidrug resistance protein